jgi:hypothetical protein
MIHWCSVISHKNRILSIKISRKCSVLNDLMVKKVEQWSKFIHHYYNKCDEVLSLDELLLSDFDECLIDGSCDQVCINENGSFDCQCVSGYEKSDHRCTAINGMYMYLAYNVVFLYWWEPKKCSQRKKLLDKIYSCMCHIKGMLERIL